MCIRNGNRPTLLATGQVRKQLNNEGQIGGKLLCRGDGFNVGQPWNAGSTACQPCDFEQVTLLSSLNRCFLL